MAAQAINPAEIANSLGEMDFRNLAGFDQGAVGVFWSEAGGPSPWELHPDCEEMLFVLEGEIEVEILPSSGAGGEKTVVPQGSFIVIPRGHWHRQYMRDRTKEMYLTPGATRMSHDPDPRK